MKTIINTLLLLFIVQQSFCQVFKQDSIGIGYFIKGSELINLGYYNEADSILSLALCSYKNENVYYNRAVSRLLQNDTIRYCSDMDIAANKYFDEIAKQDFSKTCCKKVDTIYYDKKHNIVSKQHFRYYEIIKSLKYDSLTRGSIHDIKANELKAAIDYGCDNNLLGFSFKTTDMIASYFVEDSSKYFVKTPSPVSIFNTTKYNSLKRRAKILLNSKYNHLKLENNTDNLKVYFQVYFDENGETTKIKYVGFFPEISFNSSLSDLESDLLDIANRYPKVTPAKLFNQNVKFVVYDFVDF